MEWVNKNLGKIPVKSWCREPEADALKQVANLANHPVVVKHIALMPDCHVGYGIPIGGVIACKNALIPNAVGVDIGCGVCAVKTNLPSSEINKETIQKILNTLKRSVPIGENAHKSPQKWDGFENILRRPAGLDNSSWDLAKCNLGTLGGGNHFIEIQHGNDGFIWLMIHSGSRNLGYRIAEYYHKLAIEIDKKYNEKLPDRQLAFLHSDSKEGQNYIEDMNFALEYARENRRRIIDVFKNEFVYYVKNTEFLSEINIHHNYASFELHFEEKLWIHRKGATSARKNEYGIIPGSMGTASYIVEGLGNAESFMSSSHGAGRKLGRLQACKTLNKEECERAMKGIVFDGFKRKSNRFNRKNLGEFYDLEEAPQAYKNIEEVISSELDLVKPIVKLFPLGVIKG